MNNQTVGIESFGIYIPQHFVDIEELATARKIDPNKLTKGLGLKKMSIPSSFETTQFMAKEAILDLIENHEGEWSWSNIDKIYLGTESSVDFAKPTITFVQNDLENHFNSSLEHIDFLDMTFACIGAVDALQICLDYVRLRPTKKCLVIASDIAKYDLNSGGEYTQGGGAIALLISADKPLITFDTNVGTSTQSAFDFYKPIQTFKKEKIAQELLEIHGIHEIKNYPKSINKQKSSLEGLITNFWELPEETISIHRKAPVYDGKYSNECYINRIESALSMFTEISQEKLENMDSCVFHLPYAYQGRRSAIKMWVKYFAEINADIQTQLGDLWKEKPKDTDSENYNIWLKSISKSNPYIDFVNKHIAPSETMSSEIGNMYTASIFMAMLSAIAFTDDNLQNMLFLAYGSGSKSKVFQGKIENNISVDSIKNRLLKIANTRKCISIEEYENLHSL